MTRCAERLERHPWLLPLAWALGEGYPCDPVVLAEALGVPVRLAKSLVYTGRRLGLCAGCPGVRVARSGQEFAAETGAFVLYARLRRRRVSGVALSKSGVGGSGKERLLERARRLLGSFADELP